MAAPDNKPFSDFDAQLRRLNAEREVDFFGDTQPEEPPAPEEPEEYYTSEKLAEFFSEEDLSAPEELPPEAAYEESPEVVVYEEPAEPLYEESLPESGAYEETVSRGIPQEPYDTYLQAEQAAGAEAYDAFLQAEQAAEAAPAKPRRKPQPRPEAPVQAEPENKKSGKKPKKAAPPPEEEDEEDEKPRGEGIKKFFRGIGRFLVVILTTVLLFAVAVIGAIVIVTRGPSEDAQRLFVLSTNETSALKFVPNLFLPRATVESILHPEQEVVEPHVFTELPIEGAVVTGESGEAPELVQITEATATDELELVNIKENTFKGKMLIIHDPTRVKIASIKDFGIGFGNYGLFLTDFIERSGAIAGTNAGGFYDPNGQGNGGTPDGLVICEGSLAYGSPYSLYTDVIGFDAEHVLHVGDMSGQDALDAGIVEGISFAAGPVLIENGVKRTGLGGGVNPRTCIGQRSDGAVLIMVVEGRHPDSLGATYDDLADLMEEYGAVNAANLDGGSSSTMIYNGEQITKGSTIVGSRPICTALLVMPEGGSK